MDKTITESKTIKVCDICGENAKYKCPICGKDICEKHIITIKFETILCFGNSNGRNTCHKIEIIRCVKCCGIKTSTKNVECIKYLLKQEESKREK